MDKEKKTLRPLSSFPDFNRYLQEEYDPGEPSDSDLAEMDEEDEEDEPCEEYTVWSFDHDWSPGQERDWMESRYVTDEGDYVVDRVWRGEDE